MVDMDEKNDNDDSNIDINKYRKRDKKGTPESPDKNEENVRVDFDDLLLHIGEFGWYQKGLFLCMIPFLFSVVFVYCSQIFITLVPENFWCHVPELSHLPENKRYRSDSELIF